MQFGAVKSAGSEAAARFVDLLPDNSAPDVIQRLLVTAAARQHLALSEALTECPRVQQHVDAGTMESVLSHLLAYRVVDFDVARVFRSTCAAPAAAGLQSDAVERLLLQAAATSAEMRCAEPFSEALCSLPAAQQLSSSAVLRLLQAALKHTGAGFCTFYLRQLPAAAELSNDTVADLLWTATDPAVKDHAYDLCELPAAEHMSSDTVTQLLQAAVKQNNSRFIHALCRLPQAEALTQDFVLQLYQVAMQQGKLDCGQALCGLPVAQQFDTGVLTELLLMAVEQGSTSAIQFLCDLAAAQQQRSCAAPKGSSETSHM
jgi:hypothetical protein